MWLGIAFVSGGERDSDTTERRIGIEQELFLVDERGRTSDLADEFLARCLEAGGDEGSFVEECSRGMFEINTPPADTLTSLSTGYLNRLELALRVGREIGVRLFPLAAYPLPTNPPMRGDDSYELQARTLGRENFLNAGRCIGTHLHLELCEGTTDADTVVSREATSAARIELLNLYNLAVALDPAIIALTRSTPFYEGERTGLAVRTAHYRGSADFEMPGLYANLPEVGGLKPYASNIEQLVERHRADYGRWLQAVAAAGVEEGFYTGSGGGPLKANWGPVRISGKNTVELRGIDGNFPGHTLAVAALIEAVANRIREEKLTVTPTEGTRTVQIDGDKLLVPDFPSLHKHLFHAAVTEGVAHLSIVAYLDSLVDFATEGATPDYAEKLKPDGEQYHTTEAEILEAYPDTPLSEEDGLRLVRESCDRLEEESASLLQNISLER